jgi:hypothetical protein
VCTKGLNDHPPQIQTWEEFEFLAPNRWRMEPSAYNKRCSKYSNLAPGSVVEFFELENYFCRPRTKGRVIRKSKNPFVHGAVSGSFLRIGQAGWPSAAWCRVPGIYPRSAPDPLPLHSALRSERHSTFTSTAGLRDENRTTVSVIYLNLSQY